MLGPSALWTFAALAALLGGCIPMKIGDFEGKRPNLVLERFFEGSTQG
jgi:hypothetical protein